MNNSIEFNKGIEITFSKIEPIENQLKRGEKPGSKTKAEGNRADMIEETTMTPTVDRAINSFTIGYENGKLYRNGEEVKEIEPKTVKEYLAKIGRQKDEDRTH